MTTTPDFLVGMQDLASSSRGSAVPHAVLDEVIIGHP